MDSIAQSSDERGRPSYVFIVIEDNGGAESLVKPALTLTVESDSKSRLKVRDSP